MIAKLERPIEFSTETKRKSPTRNISKNQTWQNKISIETLKICKFNKRLNKPQKFSGISTLYFPQEKNIAICSQQKKIEIKTISLCLVDVFPSEYTRFFS